MSAGNPLPPDPNAVAAAMPQQPAPDVGQATPAPPTLAPQPGQRVGARGAPLLGQMLADLIKPSNVQSMQAPGPGEIATMRPVSRAQDFEGFLGQFLYSMGQGFANEGRGPGAAYRGAGAAITAPYQQQIQQAQIQQQLAQQRAQTQQTQAQTQLTQEQAAALPIQRQLQNEQLTVAPRFDPDTNQFLGAMSQKGFESYIAGKNKGAKAAGITAGAKLESDQLKILLATQQIGNIQTDANGNKIAFNKYGQPLGQLPDAVDKAFLNKFSNTVEYKEDANGNLVALPKTTVRGIQGAGGGAQSPAAGPSVPPRAKTTTPGPAGPTVIPNFQGKNSTQMMVGTDADGSIVSGTPQELRAAGVNTFTKMDANEASKVTVSRQLVAPNGLFSLVNQDLQKLGANNLGPVASRWNDFMSGKVGTGPDFAALRTHMGLLGTALMQAHMGSKGGEGAMEHFQNLADYRISDAPTLRSALAAEYRYVNEKAARPKPKLQ